MAEQTLFSHFFVFRPWLSVIGIRIDGDSATRSKQTDDLNILGLHQFHQVLHDSVHTVLMEIPVVTEGEEIEFQAL